MTTRTLVPLAGCAAIATCLIAGCTQESAPSKETDLAKVELPKGVDPTPQAKPYKSRAKGHSAPASNQQPH